MTQFQIQPRPTRRGFSFSLHLLRVRGFLFCHAAIQPHTSVYNAFCVVHELYHTRRKTAHRALHGLFLQFDPFHSPRYKTDTTSHCTACGTLEHLPVPGRLAPIPDTRRHAGRCTGQYRPPIIIRCIRGCRGAPVIDPYQTAQHIADHANGGGVSPAGSRCFPRPAACSLAPGQRSGAQRTARNH